LRHQYTGLTTRKPSSSMRWKSLLLLLCNLTEGIPEDLCAARASICRMVCLCLPWELNCGSSLQLSLSSPPEVSSSSPLSWMQARLEVSVVLAIECLRLQNGQLLSPSLPE
jgi:hypothetical protein